MNLLGSWGGSGNVFIDTDDNRMAYGRGQVWATYRGYEIITHTGGVHGQACFDLRVPELGIGFWLAANDGTLGNPLNELVAHRILEELLQLSPVQGRDKRLVAKAGATLNVSQTTWSSWQKLPAPAHNAELRGTYTDKGYGELKIQSWEVVSSALRHTLYEAILGGGGKVRSDRPIFLAFHPHPYYMTHLLLQSDGKQGYTWFACYVSDLVQTDNGHANVTVPQSALLLGTGPAALVTHGHQPGIGMFGGWWDSFNKIVHEPVPSDPKDIQSSAEAWFRRV